MQIFAIADLHLSFNTNKSMEVFGHNWEGYVEKIKQNWIDKVNDEDLVLLPGDFSWETYLINAGKDFDFLNSLPGQKLLLKGNHDYWWTTVKSMREYLKENDFVNIDFLHNNSYLYSNHIIAGTRGWPLEEKDDKVFQREVQRLELSIKDGIKKYGNDKEIIVCLHYPPIMDKQNTNTEFVEVMKKYNVKTCIYGHLHGVERDKVIEGNIEGIEFKLVSADYMDFQLMKIG